MKREDKIADALAERLVDSFGDKAIEVIEILVSLERIIQKKERLAFADWLEKWYNRLDKAMATLNDKEINKCWKEIEAKIKKLRSERK